MILIFKDNNSEFLEEGENIDNIWLKKNWKELVLENKMKI